MNKPAASPSLRGAPRRGVSLVEALVAMAVMAFGMLAVMGVQTTLRVNADVAKQRSEATRIAEEEIERLRSFRSVGAAADAALNWDEVVQQLGLPVAMTAANTTYTLNRRVADPLGSAQKSISVEVTWVDRVGTTQRVVLGDTLAGASPVLSGLLSVPATRTASSQRDNRHPTIPVRAHELGGSSGESVFKPVEGGTIAWTFNDVSGVITRVCVVSDASTSSSLAVADLSSCVATTAQLLSGFVRFNLRGLALEFDGDHDRFVVKPIANGRVAWKLRESPNRVYRNCKVDESDSVTELADDGIDSDNCSDAFEFLISPFNRNDILADVLTAADADDPRWPVLPLSMSLGLTSTGHLLNGASQAPLCYANSPTGSLTANQSGQYLVEYFCIIFPNTPKTWSGTSVVVPGAFADYGGSANAWTIGTGSTAYRVCRYTQASVATTTNADHPLAYDNVSGNLINQNFLVVAGPKACPTDVAANPAAGDLVNTNTLQHQP